MGFEAPKRTMWAKYILSTLSRAGVLWVAKPKRRKLGLYHYLVTGAPTRQPWCCVAYLEAELSFLFLAPPSFVILSSSPTTIYPSPPLPIWRRWCTYRSHCSFRFSHQLSLLPTHCMFRSHVVRLGPTTYHTTKQQQRDCEGSMVSRDIRLAGGGVQLIFL